MISRTRALAPLLLSVSLLTLAPSGTAQTSAEDDPGFLERIIQSALGGEGREVTIRGLEGVLSSEARIGEITVADAEGVWLSISNVALNWQRLAIFRGRLEVNALTVGDISVARAPLPPPRRLPSPEAAAPEPETEETDPAGFALPELPVSVRVDQLAIGAVRLGQPLLGQSAELSVDGNARLASGEGDVALRLVRQDGPEGLFDLAAGFANETRELRVDLDFQEAAGGLIATLARIPGAPPVSLTVAGDDPISDFEATLALSTDDVERLAGEVRITESPEPTLDTDAPLRFRQTIEARLGGDVTELFIPEYKPFFGDSVAFDVRALRSPSEGISVETFNLSAAALDLTGSVDLDPEFAPRLVDVQGIVASPLGLPVVLPLPGAATLVDRTDFWIDFDAAQDDALVVEADARNLLREDGILLDRVRLRADGQIRFAENNGIAGVAADIDADLDGLAVTDPRLFDAAGENAELSAQVDWDSSGTVTLREMDLRSEELALRGDAAARGLTGETPEVELSAALATGPLTRFSALTGTDLTGRFETTLEASYALASGAFDVALDGDGSDIAIGQPQADAVLTGPVRLDLVAARGAEGLTVDRLELATDVLSLDGGGVLASDGGDLRLAGGIADLSVLGVDTLSGPLSLDAALVGEDNAWTADFDLVSQEARIVGDAEIENLLNGPISVRADAEIDTGDIARLAPLVGMPLTGRFALDAAAAFDAASGDGQVRADGRGTGLSVGIPQLDALLAGAVTLALDAARTDGDLNIRTARLASDQLSVRADGGMRDGVGQFDTTVALTDIGRVVEGLGGPVTLRAGLEGRDRSWQVAGNLTGPQGTTAVISGDALRPDGTVDLTLTGSVPLLIADPFITPRTIVGDATLDFRMRGQPGLDALRGTLTVANARASDPATRIAVEDIDLTVALANARAQIDMTGGLATGGRIEVSGPIDLTPPLDANIRADLNDLVLLDPTLYEINMNGNAQVQGPLLGNANIRARIGIDRAEIKIPSSLGGPGALAEVTHIAEPAGSRETRRRAGLDVDPPEPDQARGGGPVYGLDIRVSALRQIFVRGRGLDVEMGGIVTVGGTTAAPVTGGGIRIRRGQFALLNQRLEFERAEISLQGDLVPNLDMVAYSDSGNVRAQILIAGPVTAPELSFRSDPELPEDEVLAQLFFGKPINELTPFEVAQLVASVNRLTGGGPGLLGGLREGIGVDNLGVSTDEEGNTEVTAGKYLTERLYTDVTVGADGTSEIELNYDFNSTFKGRVGFDSENNSSVGFAFERDY